MARPTQVMVALLAAAGLIAVAVCAAPPPAQRTIREKPVAQRRLVKKKVYLPVQAARRFTQTYPDLVIEDVSLQPGDTQATVVVTVRNQGTAVAHGFHTEMEISRGRERLVRWTLLTPLAPDTDAELTYRIAAVPDGADLSLTVDPPTEDSPFGCQLEGVASPDRAVSTLPGEANNTAEAVYSGDPQHPEP